MLIGFIFFNLINKHSLIKNIIFASVVNICNFQISNTNGYEGFLGD